MKVKLPVNLEAINPANHSKYSQNIYEYLKREKGWFLQNTVVVTEDLTGDLYVGYFHDGLFNGSRLSEVLCRGRKAERWCLVNATYSEIVNFWEKYEAIGLCAIDPEHVGSYVKEEGRWVIDGDSRTCQWCGNCRQALRRWEEVVRRQAWVNE